MGIFADWCANNRVTLGKTKSLWTLAEKKGGREIIRSRLATAIRSHYSRLDRIADDIARLGYEGAAEILRSRLPRTSRARSGDLAEILATEFVEEATGFRVPVRRLRYKDCREMALRGDDFIGVANDNDDGLRLLKGESKSRKALGNATISKAREALCRSGGRCTPESLLFVADHLLDSEDKHDIELGRAIRDEVGREALRPDQIDHMLFALSGNAVSASLEADLDNAGTERNQYAVSLCIEDHQEFIAAMFTEVQNLGDE